MIDSHCHIYLPEFDNDREETILRAKTAGIDKIILPNIDYESIERMQSVSSEHPEMIFNTLGLHPTSVKEDYKEQLEKIFSHDIKIYGIGETGIDLYWDKTFLKEQLEAFDFQLDKACSLNLPIIIHSRNSTIEVIDLARAYKSKGIKGVFHCFPGNLAQAKEVINLGFHIGIGGVITYKNNNMYEVVENIPTEFILTETDSPYLTPVPFRGKRNEPAYINNIVEAIALIKNEDKSIVANTTSQNCLELFSL